jgi:hypothetical protein
MLSILKLRVRAQSLPLRKQALRVLRLIPSLFSELVDLVFEFILLLGLKLISLPVFQDEAPEIELADIE